MNSRTRQTLLEILADGHFHSGTLIGQRLGLSRTAVWKHLRALDQSGLTVHAVPGRGYRLAQPLELLDGERITRALPESDRAVIDVLEVLPETDSTNSYLMRRPLTDGVQVCLAEYQSGGRGRRGRQWWSPPASNLYLSLMWHSGTMAPALLPLLPLVMGVAVARTLSPCQVALKWPNDVMAGQAKLAGILVEMAGESGGEGRVVAGVGVNVLMPDSPEAVLSQPWTDLGRSGCTVSRNALAAGLITDILVTLRNAGEDSHAVLEEWRRLDYLSGQEVLVQTPYEVFTGCAAGVDDSGMLLVRTREGLRRLHGGEVSVRKKASVNSGVLHDTAG